MNPDLVVPAGGVRLEDCTEARATRPVRRCKTCLAVKRGLLDRVFHRRVCGGAEWREIRARFIGWRTLQPDETAF